MHGKQCLAPYGFQDAGVDGRRRRHPALGVPATLLRGRPPPPGPWPPERRPKAGSKLRSPCPTIRGRQPDETCRPKSFLTPRLFQASCPRGTRARLRDPAHGWVSLVFPKRTNLTYRAMKQIPAKIGPIDNGGVCFTPVEEILLGTTRCAAYGPISVQFSWEWTDWTEPRTENTGT